MNWCKPVIQADPRTAGMMPVALAHARGRHDAAVEDRADHGSVRHRIAGRHLTSGVQHRHARRQARSRRAAVDPARRDDAPRCA